MCVSQSAAAARLNQKPPKLARWVSCSNLSFSLHQLLLLHLWAGGTYRRVEPHRLVCFFLSRHTWGPLRSHRSISSSVSSITSWMFSQWYTICSAVFSSWCQLLLTLFDHFIYILSVIFPPGRTTLICSLSVGQTAELHSLWAHTQLIITDYNQNKAVNHTCRSSSPHQRSEEQKLQHSCLRPPK